MLMQMHGNFPRHDPCPQSARMATSASRPVNNISRPWFEDGRFHDDNVDVVPFGNGATSRVDAGPRGAGGAYATRSSDAFLPNTTNWC